MEVDVEHRLPGGLAVVGDDAVAIRLEVEVAGDLGDAVKGHADDRSLALVERVERGDVPARDDQAVRRRLRVDVVESDGDVVLELLLRRDLAGDDAAEEATVISGHGARMIRRRAGCRRGRGWLRRPAVARLGRSPLRECTGFRSPAAAR